MDTDIVENIARIRNAIPAGVRLVAVSKFKPVEAVQAAYDAGQRLFGENHALEMRDKHDALPKDIEWHFIGHLQSNKVKYIAPFVSIIHSIDSLELLRVVNKEGKKNDRVIPCLLQFHVASEETKFGLDLEEGIKLLESEDYKAMANVKLVGVMGMATNTPDSDKVRSDFRHLKETFDVIKEKFFANNAGFKEVSMGMSHDYPIAIEEGATIVRIGSSIFGVRDNAKI